MQKCRAMGQIRTDIFRTQGHWPEFHKWFCLHRQCSETSNSTGISGGVCAGSALNRSNFGSADETCYIKVTMQFGVRKQM